MSPWIAGPAIAVGIGAVLLIVGVWTESWRIRKLRTPEEWDKAQKAFEQARLRARLAHKD